MERNTSIDIMRFVFAFLVVVIHVPIVGGEYVMPLARCSVPFFYVVSGFYLFSDEKERQKMKMATSARKWFLLWFVYSVVLSSIVLVYNSVYDSHITWTGHDTELMLLSGVCPALDLIRIKDVAYGTSVLWFLYSGAFAFTLLYIARKLLGTKILSFAVAVIFTSSLVVNYSNENIIVPRTVSVALPCIYLGYMMKKHIEMISVFSTSRIMVSIALFTATLYVEALFRHVEVYMSTIPLTLLVFMYLIKNPSLFNVRLRIPVKVSMDIYIWHRLAYALLFGLFSLKALEPLAAIIVFTLVMLIATIYRKSMAVYAARLKA